MPLESLALRYAADEQESHLYVCVCADEQESHLYVCVCVCVCMRLMFSSSG